jgi:hypothetical protein
VNYIKVLFMRRITGIVLMSLLFKLSVNAQEGKYKYVERTNVLLGIQVGIPGSPSMKEATKNNMGNMGFGGALCVLTNPFAWGRNKRNSPLRIGGELGYTYYGRFLSDVNINGYGGDYKTSYGILQLNGLLQLRPGVPEYFTPFIDVFAGGSFYISSTKENLSAIESGLGIPSFEIGSYSSASFTKGAAIGCSIGKFRENQARFTMRVSYTWGPKIRYVVRNSLAYNPSDGLQISIGETYVRYFLVQVGIGI